MPKLLALPLLLICVAVTSACSSVGPVVRPNLCPTLPPAPANLMQPPETERKVRDELFEPQPNATPKSEDYKNSSGLSESSNTGTMTPAGGESLVRARYPA